MSNGSAYRRTETSSSSPKVPLEQAKELWKQFTGKVYPLLDQLSLPQHPATLATITILLLLSVFNVFGELTSNMLAFGLGLFPTLQILREHPSSEEAPWLLFWVVFAALHLFESTFSFVIKYFAYYSVVKTVGLLLLFSHGGKNILHAFQWLKTTPVYDRVIRKSAIVSDPTEPINKSD